MTKQPKTPTIADLRRQERRAGMDIEELSRGGGLVTELWWSNEMTHFATFNAPLNNPVVRMAVFGALSALPDAPKEGQR